MSSSSSPSSAPVEVASWFSPGWVKLWIALAVIAVVLVLFRRFRWRIASLFYDRVMANMEKTFLSKLRKEFVPHVSGKVLDVAVGTGSNIPYYTSSCSEVILTDQSAHMLSEAQEKASVHAEYLRKQQVQLQFVVAPLENLPFPTASFDSSLSIDVLCSVQDPYKCVQEVQRVVKVGGRCVFVEHGRTNKLWSNVKLYIVSFFSQLTVGASMTRPIEQYIKAANSLRIDEYGHRGNSFKYFICTRT